jgi:H/ACA ribonucleoprotein complex subunit 3
VPNSEVLLRYGERPFREAGISNSQVLDLFRDLYQTITELHQKRVVIGDFNDLNVLISNAKAFLVDADSFQFDKFLCKVFTAKFVDPLLCAPKASSPSLMLPFNHNSDWYAFSVMLMQSLLFVDPYGGVYLPIKSSNKIPHSARPLHHITIFHPEVRYPKPAIPYETLPDELLEYFHQIFEKDKREIFPLDLLEKTFFVKCPSCNVEHAHKTCPLCQFILAIPKQLSTIRGEVTATLIFSTSGIIVFAQFQSQHLKFLIYQDGVFKRENGTVVCKQELTPNMRFRIQGSQTLIAHDSIVEKYTPRDETPQKILIETYNNLPVFDTNSHSLYWLAGGQLLRSGNLGSVFVGDILSNQTLFWCGEKFGFGFYRSGKLNAAFTFDAARGTINDNLQLPPIHGQLVDSTCVFTQDKCWFFISVRDRDRTINHCHLISPEGKLEATSQAVQGDGSWLGKIRGNLALGNFLFCATDEGVVRIESDGSDLVKTRDFPDTEPFVDSSNHLFPAPNGLYVVGRRDVYEIKIT